MVEPAIEPEIIAMINSGYIAAIEWAPSGEECEGLALREYDSMRTVPRQVFEFIGRCHAGAGLGPVDLWRKHNYSPERFGVDFWLSRNGHGAGFFDRDELPEDVRDKLQEIAQQCGEIDTFRDDDGNLALDG